jgi:hypothetical protein
MSLVTMARFGIGRYQWWFTHDGDTESDDVVSDVCDDSLLA